MRVIAITNQKGGVGKTTTAINFATILDGLGERVLLVDLDPQGSATASTLGQPAKDDGAGLLDVLGGQRRVSVVSRRIRYLSQASVVPSGPALAKATHLYRDAIAGGQLALRDALRAESDRWDTVLIDCPPVDVHLITTALCAADFVVIPSTLEPASSRGLADLTNTIFRVRDALNPDLRVVGVLPTMVHENRGSSGRIADLLRDELGERALFQSYIRADAAVPELDERARPVVRRPSARAAKDYRDAVEETRRRIEAA